MISTSGLLATTDAYGRFVLTKLPKSGPAITARRKYYADTRIVEPSGKNARVAVRMPPVPVTVTVLSNLSGTPLRGATVSAAGTRVSAATGTATLYQVGDGDKVTVTASGYNGGVATISGATGRVTLIAGPTLGARYIYQTEINQDWNRLYGLIHPIELPFEHKKKFIASNKKDADDGYALVSYKIKSVTILPTWRFPGCNGKGITTLHNVAAVAWTTTYSAPGGNGQTSSGVEHLAQDPKDHLWKFFPLDTQCPTP